VFWKGSQQAIHKDTAYVQVEAAPMELAATWLALEDVTDGVGALEYYIGSHRAPDYLFGGAHKWMEHAPHEHDDFLRSHHADAEKFGYRKGTFLAREGDVLIWHADLAHGGGVITRPDATRQSLVTHLTAGTRSPPYQRRASRVPHAERGMLFIAEERQI
jgi:phytanoyl-CoA hydroxylase